jgi:raffinose/stachyose/melibiose transport system substrate-binding protein
MFAPNSEGTLVPYGAFAITRASPHPAQALDFLRFITSQREDRKFVAIADTLPVIDGVEAPGFMANFTPDGRGFPQGPTLMAPGDVGMLVARDEYLLFGPQGSVDSFLEALARDLPAAARGDLTRGERQLLETVALNDASVESAHRLAHEYHRSAVLERKYQSIVETQNEQEASAYYMDLRLRRSDSLK